MEGALMKGSCMFARAHCSAAILIGISLLMSCAPKMRPVYEDPSFTGGALRSGGLAVLGVVGRDLTNPEEGQVADQADQCLAASMKKMLPGVTIVEVPAVRDRVGESAWKEMRVDVSDSDSLASDSKRLLADSATHFPAFLMAARVGTERNWHEMNQDGKGGTGYRKITLRVNIYRVADGALVWSQMGEHTAFETSSKDEGIKIWKVTVGGSGDDWYPVPPKVVKVLSSIFDKVGETLAKRP